MNARRRHIKREKGIYGLYSDASPSEGACKAPAKARTGSWAEAFTKRPAAFIGNALSAPLRKGWMKAPICKIGEIWQKQQIFTA
jgi:hypothetical protein